MTRRWVGSIVALFVASLAPLAARAQQAVPTVAESSRNPHGKLKEECATCHRSDAWTPAKISPRFVHAPGRFPLEGAHASVTCRSCHTSLDFKGVNAKCAGCHEDIHRGELGVECARCHTPRSFLDRTVMQRAHQATRFPLTGAHVTADCSSCHTPAAQGQLSFVNRQTECVSCHLPAYNATTSPAHAASGFPQQCEVCHTTVAWNRAKFDHRATAFPLTGAHVPLACSACHGDGVYRGKSTLCVSCHTKDYSGTTDPPHASAGFPTTCESCHTTTTWVGAAFDHNATLFPLTGAHKPLACNSCHGDGVYKGKSTLCLSCHTKDYNGTTDPPHVAAGFPTTCATCHTTTTWIGATFDHNMTLFPLTGAHKPLACNSCHGDGVYKGKSTACVSCHLDKYNSTTDPKHVNAGFPTTCASCHTTTTWTGATFDHNTTLFPLTGAHKPLACTACHGDGVFKGKSTACVACHQTDYNGTNNPAHAQAGFPTTCQGCHTTTTWTGATFNHTYFPTNHGNAGGVCSTCHTNTSNFALFTCTTCHAQATTDSHHTQVRGYRYDSNACYSCHPSGHN
ncbi:MAG: hypothetical protein ABIQ10_05010 [Gemmatimonadaceae bacterium]